MRPGEPGEIFALTCDRLQGHYAEIWQRFYKGHLDTPKTVKSIREVALSKGLIAEIEGVEASVDRYQTSSLGFPF